jgi:RHS repeat-associated protein
MPVTSYISVGGRMISEVTDGVILDYVPDALGSIHSVIDQDANVVKTMRYKPYGEVLSRSGTVADRHYQWVGTYGYRATFAPSSSHYVRARHYTATGGSWTTVDPLWPHESAYGYVGGNATRDLDPSGTSSCQRNWSGCPKPALASKITNDCIREGTRPCYIRAVPGSNKDECLCCGVCYTRCDAITKLGGVLCGGFNSSAMKECASKSIKRWLNGQNQIVPSVPPKVDPSKNCPNCTPPGREGSHYQWDCKPKSKGVITASCCACYRNGEVRMICFTSQGCHNNKGAR